MSYHLALLGEARLVDATQDGKSILYQLAKCLGSATAGKFLDLGWCQLSIPTRNKSTK